MRPSLSVRVAILAAASLIALVLPASAHAAKRWAVVRPNGTFVRGTSVASASRTGPGAYLVTFDTAVGGCAYVANPGDPGTGAVADPVVAAVSRRANPRTLAVRTYNEAAAAPADEPFHVAVSCGASPSAVVGRGGTLARGTHAVSARRLRRGEYGVHFDRDVTGCVLTASIGSTGAMPVAAPGAISVAPGRKPHNAFVTTLGRDGRPDDFPFHLAAACGRSSLRAGVTSDGTVLHGGNVVSANRLSAGSYEVIFDRDVSACAYTATIGRPSPGFTRRSLTITTASRGGNPNGAFVFIHDVSGAVADHAFDVVAHC
jgi:hypothetical protein